MSGPFYADRHVTIWHANALALPIDDATVDLIVTSPPYFGLRSYRDQGEHYAGQLGSETTPAEFVDALIAATREMVRVLKPSGSIFVNLGDKYAQSGGGGGGSSDGVTGRGPRPARKLPAGIRDKSLIGVPWRYALRCIDDLGLILRAEIIWSKPNGLPESVTDRVRRSHEQWFHFVQEPRYFSAVDEIREPQIAAHLQRQLSPQRQDIDRKVFSKQGLHDYVNPLGKMPGSVWTVPTQPLVVPAHLGEDHYAAFPMEWPRRIILGWSPPGVCTVCGEGRRPVVAADRIPDRPRRVQGRAVDALLDGHGPDGRAGSRYMHAASITGYACACPDPSAPTRPAVVLDPFCGTGTVMLVAKALGRRGVGVDLSRDYCWIARWRCTDPGELARAMHVEKPAPVDAAQGELFEVTS